MNKIRTLSLFSGAGGLDIGFKKSDFDIVGCLEIDKPSCETLELNRGTYVSPGCRIFNSDITVTQPEELNLDNVDFILGGPPCQSFSAAGRRAGGVHGINDTRGSLFWFYCQYLKYFQPKGFLFENVRGILNANKAKDWEIIKKSFRDVGYRLHYRVLDTAFYGVPQHRERVIMVGVRNDIDLNFMFPRPTHGPDSADKKPYVSVGQAISDIDDPFEVIEPYTGKYGYLLNDIPEGLNYSFYTERMGHPEPLFAWRSKFSGFLYKLDRNLPSKTVVAHQGKYDGPFHWKNRKPNKLELKRIQSFPDDYQFVKSQVEVVRQIGNSVPPKMAEKLANAIANQVFNKKNDIELIDQNSKLSFDTRKANKAKASKMKLPRINTVDSRQLTLLQEKNDWLNEEEIYELSFPLFLNKTFEVQKKVNSGACHLTLYSKDIKSTYTASVNVFFDRPIGNAFNEIRAKITSDTAVDLSCLWDVIHRLIGENCSYDSLQPLFGHFTEPYPKFFAEIKYETSNTEIEHQLKFIRNFTNFEYIKKVHKIDELTKLGLDLEFIKELRNSQFDIRTHETNRAIPEDHFKICYPFSLMHTNKNYTVWRNKGSHKTGDFRFKDLN